MLKVAERKALEAAPLSGSLKLIQADMRNFDLRRQFPVVMIPARTLLLATTEEDQFHTLCCAARHLEPDGTLAFNLFYPDPEMLADDPDEEFLLEVVEKADGRSADQDTGEEGGAQRDKPGSHRLGATQAEGAAQSPLRSVSPRQIWSLD